VLFLPGEPAPRAGTLELGLTPTAFGPIAVEEGFVPRYDGEPLALATRFGGEAGEVVPEFAVRVSGGTAGPAPTKPKKTRRASNVALTPQRAQALLRSMTVPGWGQATLGHHTSATVFAVAEAGIWASFLAFRLQEELRIDSSIRTARYFAGINLTGRDDEFLKIVGAYASSDEYNLLVVSRDAANQYYDQPELYRAYIAEHSLSGANAWTWQDQASFLRYGSQRKEAQRAALRVNTALALAIANRIVSVLHAARLSSKAPLPGAASWNFEVVPAGGKDPTAFHYGVRARF
jgi:hypothetical protein